MLTAKEYIEKMQDNIFLDVYSLRDVEWFMENYAGYVAEEKAKLAPVPPVNADLVNKYVILLDIHASDYMKDENGKIIAYDNAEEAAMTCGMYEFEDAIVVKVVYNHIEA